VSPRGRTADVRTATCILVRTTREQKSVVLPELEALGHTHPHDGVVVELDSARR